jgi:hypothetical protein
VKWARWRNATVYACVLTATLASEATARAASTAASSPEAASDAERDEVRALFQQGVTLLDAARYADALAKFERAYALWNNPKIMLNIATTRRALGRNAEAASAYAMYLATAPSDSPRRDEVVSSLRELTVLVGRIVLTSSAGIERLWLNAKELPPKAGDELWVEPGSYVMTAERTGGARFTQRFDVYAAEVRRVDFTPAARLSPAPRDVSAPPDKAPLAADAPAAGRLLVLARVDVDWVRTGAVAAAGLGFDLTEAVRLTGGALLGVERGAWLGVELLPFAGPLRPTFGVSMPVFFLGQPYPGISGEVGLRYAVAPRFAPFVRASAVRFLSPPGGYAKAVFLTSAGLEVTL